MNLEEEQQMQNLEKIKKGISRDTLETAKTVHLAAHIGSGSSQVLATPVLISYIERNVSDLLDEHLPEGYTSVGVHLNINHLAPSPLGSTVRKFPSVNLVEGNRVNLVVTAWDDLEKIAESTHQRVVIETERFLRRVEKKSLQI
jgi:predicted thioesterase